MTYFVFTGCRRLDYQSLPASLAILDPQQEVLERLSHYHQPKKQSIVLYQPPEIIMAETLAQGLNPETAVSVMQQSLQQLIRFFKLYRDDVTLVALLPDESAPPEITGLLPNDLYQELALQLYQQSCAEPLYQIMASALAGIEGFRRLVTELSACSLYSFDYMSLGSQLIFSCQQITGQQHNLNDQITQANSRIAALQNENMLLQQTLQTENDRLKHEREQWLQEKNSLLQEFEQESNLLIAELAKAQENLDKTQAENQSLQQFKQDLQQENELIIAELYRVQELFENKLTELQQLQGEFLQAQQHKRWLITHLHKTRSRFWSKSRYFRRWIQQHADELQRLGQFSEQDYLQRYPDLANSPHSALIHYVLFGMYEDRNPVNNFNTYYYVGQYADVAQSSITPWLHYLRFGRDEGRVSVPSQSEQ